MNQSEKSKEASGYTQEYSEILIRLNRIIRFCILVLYDARINDQMHSFHTNGIFRANVIKIRSSYLNNVSSKITISAK